jgi:hypothetical protein
MKTSDNIYNLIHKHKVIVGQYPDTIYLGQEEYMSLVSENNRYGNPCDPIERKCFGINFFDLPIENHLAVSFTKK